ncbi:MAG: oligopeptide transporter, OPT family [Gammaproteobacteria bacterium RIFCSPHIGHO2_12_FULL_41_15]|nr:MAG: oligopeptide transporter, OPT family [Gammaproteobacteria bacterium RIFCSPHIGHO2_12_FULL_41_15]
MHKPIIAAEQTITELSLKTVLLGLFLALILAISNTYLALKIGVLTASSIPAAILSMGILRFFKTHTVLENNLVQTCASAGEAIAGGVVYTVPALVILRYWLSFSYIESFTIAIVGGVLGVLFTIPLRRVYMTHQELRFPEGQAIAQVLIMGMKKSAGIGFMMMGSVIGAAFELAQTGLKLLADSVQFWITRGHSTFGFGTGFAATLIGAGYLMGFEVGLSILMGAIIANLGLMPILSHLFYASSSQSARSIAIAISADKIRYIGIGAMLTSGVITLISLLKPMAISLKTSVQQLMVIRQGDRNQVERTDFDMPLSIVIAGILLFLILSLLLILSMFNLPAIFNNGLTETLFLISVAIYLIVLGFLFSAMCGYFSGLVGVTASPGSSIAIASVLIAAVIMQMMVSYHGNHPALIKEAMAITIVISSIVMGAACVANNNSQDLKVGYILGATPWKQQLMLLLGGVVACLIIPMIMQLLFSVYGIAGVMPQAGMNVSNSLAAPPAAAMAAVAQAMFQHDLPWNMMLIGAVISVAMSVITLLLPKQCHLSVIGIAMGIYLPLSSSTPLFIGALIALLANRHKKSPSQTGMILACGLVAGAAIMNVILAIPFSIMHNPDQFALLPASGHTLTESLATIATLGLSYFVYRVAKNSP